MKKIIAFCFLALIALTSSSNAPSPHHHQTKMKIRIGNKSFSAILHDTPAATSLKAMLPISFDMVELNGNEKYCDLPKKLPTNEFNPGKIEAGEILLYGSSILVVFYKSLATSYRYTKIGKIDDVNGLAAALGPGNVKVIFEKH